jgi:hypothetical protein
VVPGHGSALADGQRGSSAADQPRTILDLAPAAVDVARPAADPALSELTPPIRAPILAGRRATAAVTMASQAVSAPDMPVQPAVRGARPPTPAVET